MLNTFRAWLVDASTSIAFRGRGHATSNTLSAPVSFRLSGGSFPAYAGKFHYVLTCVVVSIVVCLARRAIPFLHAEHHVGVDITTVVAAFRGREETIRKADFLPIPIRLVFQHPAKHAEAGTTHRLGETTIFNHASHVQVLDTEHVKLTDEPSGQLVEAVLAAVSDVCLKPGHFQLLRLPAITAIRSSR